MLHGTGASSPYIGDLGAIPALCIPAMGLQDGPAGVGDGMGGVTQMPAPITEAATFDTALEQQYGAAIGAEFAGKGANVDLGPTVNIIRDPRWGRAFETFSEDPYLAVADGRRGRPGHPEPGRDGAGQARGRLQPGDEPQRAGRQRDRRRPHAQRDLPAGVPGVGDARVRRRR